MDKFKSDSSREQGTTHVTNEQSMRGNTSLQIVAVCVAVCVSASD